MGVPCAEGQLVRPRAMFFSFPVHRFRLQLTLKVSDFSGCQAFPDFTAEPSWSSVQWWSKQFVALQDHGSILSGQQFRNEIQKPPGSKVF